VGPCDVEGVAIAHPASDGATDFYYRGAVEFSFDGIDEDASITLSNEAGTELAGATSWVGSKLVFQPNAPLTPDSNYFVALTHCAGTSNISFHTSMVGTALEGGPSELVGKTYVFDLDSGRFVAPAGVGSLLLGMLEQDLLLGVVGAIYELIEVTGAFSQTTSSAQDRCEASIDFPGAADFTAAPFFSIGPQDITFDVAGFETPLRHVQISGDFTSDGSQITEAIFTSELDARDWTGAFIAAGILDDADPGSVCATFSTFGVSCEACALDGAAYCVDIYIDQITADLDDQTLVVQDECDPEACETGCDE
jgi:hypothetical protein